MFLGVVPSQCIEQMLVAVDFGSWGRVHTCCSGSFRIERALAAAHPTLPVVANDVSLFSCALGDYLTGAERRIEFVHDLSFIEEHIAGRDFGWRVAAVMAALNLTRFAAGQSNVYKTKHLAHLKGVLPATLEGCRRRLDELKGASNLAGFAAKDWRDHAMEAASEGHGIAAFPPFWMGGYEKMFEFIDQNVSWDAPAYDVYDPATLPQIVSEIEKSASPFFILSDQKFEAREPDFLFRVGYGVPHYGYIRGGRSSLRMLRPAISTSAPFGYKPIDVTKLGPNSVVRCVPVRNPQINFVRDVYLTAGLAHSNGELTYLIYVDEMLVGGAAYRRPNRNVPGHNNFDSAHRITEILSDFSIVSTAKLSKLVAMIAVSRDLVRPMDAKRLRRTDLLTTNIQSEFPSSMKYRGVMKQIGRLESKNKDTGRPWRLTYVCEPVEKSPQQTYEVWWKKYGQKAIEQHLSRDSKGRPEVPAAP